MGTSPAKPEISIPKTGFIVEFLEKVVSCVFIGNTWKNESAYTHVRKKCPLPCKELTESQYSPMWFADLMCRRERSG
jgi:hypothetical protein